MGRSHSLASHPVTLRRNDYIAAALAAIIALLVYLRTLPPTFTGDDSPEFITAIYTLGIAHPPGYPLFCMLGKLFTLAVPFNTVAWRVALMSACFGAVTCFVVSLFVTKLTRNALAGLAGALMLAVSSEFWKWSVVVETYTLNAFLIVLAMLFLLVWYETREPKWLYAFALVYGLGLCNHHTMHFMGPAFALFILSIDRRPWRQWRMYLLTAAIVVVTWGLVHLYIPIRAAADPYSNWGNVSTWDNFWRLVTRAQYGGGFEKAPFTFGHFFKQMGLFASVYGGQFTVFLAAVPLVGIYPLWTRNRYAAGLVIGTALYIVIGISVITNFALDQESIWLNTKFWLPAYVMAAILGGVAVGWLVSLRPGTVNPKVACVCLGVVVFVVPLVGHYRSNDKSDYYFAHDYGMNLLNTMDQNALYFSANDHALYPLFYLQAVEGLRPDVTIVRKYGYIEKKFYQDMPASVRKKLAVSKNDQPIEEWIIADSGRPAYFSEKAFIQDIPGARMVNAGLLYKVIGPDDSYSDRDYWSSYTWHSLELGDALGDSPAENILSTYHFARGRAFLGEGDRANGIVELSTAAECAGRRPNIINNIGSSLVEYGLAELGMSYYRRAITIDSNFRPALRNLSITLRNAGDYAAAKDYLERVVALDMRHYGDGNPYVAQSINELGGLQLELEDFDGARCSFKRALSIDQRALGNTHPNTMRDLSNLSIAIEAVGDTDRAAEYRKRAVETLSRTMGDRHPLTRQARRGRFIKDGV